MKKFQDIIKKLFWVPFVISFIGYYYMEPLEEGHDFWVAIYESIALYFVNPVSDKSNTLIVIGQLLSVVVMSSVLLSIVSVFIGSISKWFISFSPDSVAVYTDNEIGNMIASTCRHGFVSSYNMIKNRRIERTKYHFIMYSNDKKNFEFLLKHIDSFDNKVVYVLFKEIDLTILKNDRTNIRYLNVADMVARDYWSSHNLHDEVGDGKTLKIGMIGFDCFGKAIFKYGYLNNIYSLGQKIEYHIWGANQQDRLVLNKLDMCNGDTVICHNTLYDEEEELIESLDRVIIADGEIYKKVQGILSMSQKLNIHVCCHNGIDICDVFEGESLVSFGDYNSLLDEKKIKNEQTYRMAKLFNYDYYLRTHNAPLPDKYTNEMETEWNKLSGFLRGSNIARADFYRIEKRMLTEGADSDFIKRIEHIRWCRYLFINHWQYGEIKDEKQRTHPLLVGYDQLSHEEQEKDDIFNQTIREEIEKLL